MPWRIWWLSSISRRDLDPSASAGPPREVDPRPRAGPSAGPSIVSPWVKSATLAAPRDRLADREQVAFAVFEPGGSFADTALTRIVASDLRDPVDRGQAGQVIAREDHAAGLELRDGRVDVADLPGHLGVRARGSAVGLEQRELASRAAVQQAARPLLHWLQAELLGVERSRPLQILRGQPRRDATTRKHDRSPPRLLGSPGSRSTPRGLWNPSPIDPKQVRPRRRACGAYVASSATRLIRSTPPRAREMMQPVFASSARCWNEVSSSPGTSAAVSRSICWIVGMPPTLRRWTRPVVLIERGAWPAWLRTSESAIEKQAACAAASSSSGLVLAPSRRASSVGNTPLNLEV